VVGRRLIEEFGGPVAVDGPKVLVGPRAHGAFVTGDDGATWKTLEDPEPMCNAISTSAAHGAL
jgi:hypothetical protein